MADGQTELQERRATWWTIGGFVGVLLVLLAAIGWAANKGTLATSGASAPPLNRVEERTAEPERQATDAAPLLATLSGRTDDMEEITWYEDRSTKRRHDGLVAYFYFARFDSMVRRKSSVSPFGPLRFKARYEGRRWIFVRRLTLKVDGELHSITPNEWKRHVFTGGSLWEWCDVPLSVLDADLAKALANARAVKIRFEGSEGVRDWSVPKAQLAAMKRVYDVWSAQPK